jgi:hypothetical protein
VKNPRERTVTKMEGQLKVRKGNCFININTEYAYVEKDGTGFVVDHIRPVCNVWREDNDVVRFQVYRFESIPSNGVAEPFALLKGDWTVQLYRWKDGSFVIELWEDSIFTASLEWNNEKGLAVYVYGNPEAFIRFVEETFAEQDQEQG